MAQNNKQNVHFLHISAPKAVLMGYSALYSEITAHMLLNLSCPTQKRTLPGGDIVRSELYRTATENGDSGQ